jgi:hypothetical protein
MTSKHDAEYLARKCASHNKRKEMKMTDTKEHLESIDISTLTKEQLSEAIWNTGYSVVRDSDGFLGLQFEFDQTKPGRWLRGEI